MSLYLLHVVFAAQALVFVFVKQLDNQVNNIIRVVNPVLLSIRENNFCALNLSKQHVFVAIEERSDSNEHLVNQNSKCPPIDGLAMPLIGDHLRS